MRPEGGGGGGGGGRGKQGQTIKNLEKKLKKKKSINVHSFLPFVFRFVKWAIFYIQYLLSKC